MWLFSVAISQSILSFVSCSTTGGILTGVLSDVLNARALSCIISLVLAVPSVSSSCYVSSEPHMK